MPMKSRRGHLLDWSGFVLSSMFILALTFGLIR